MASGGRYWTIFKEVTVAKIEINQTKIDFVAPN